jgi:hypothetical protein
MRLPFFRSSCGDRQEEAGGAKDLALRAKQGDQVLTAASTLEAANRVHQLWSYQ